MSIEELFDSQEYRLNTPYNIHRKRIRGSLIRYIGKRQLDLDYEKKAFEFKCYCEPFSGSFNSGIELIESGYKTDYILNDLDERMYTLWKCIKERPIETFKRIEELLELINIEGSIEGKHQMLQRESKSLIDVDRAASEYVYRLISGIHGIEKTERTLRYSLYDFMSQSELLNENKVEINMLDYSEMLSIIDRKYGSDAFYYIDPPYAIDSVDRYYRCESRSFDHVRLREEIGKLSGKFIITYNNSEFIRELYTGFNQYIISKNIFGSRYTELVITNYDKPRESILGYLCDAVDYIENPIEEHEMKIISQLNEEYIKEGKVRLEGTETNTNRANHTNRAFDNTVLFGHNIDAYTKEGET